MDIKYNSAEESINKGDTEMSEIKLTPEKEALGRELCEFYKIPLTKENIKAAYMSFYC